MNTNSHAKRNLILAALLLSLAIAYTFAVRFIDVAPIGPEGSSVGFSSLNRFIFELLGVDLFFYTLTDRLGVVAILVAASFAVLGLCQWIGRLLSGVHRFSDIVGGILYSAALLSLFCASLSLAKWRRNAGKRA